MRKGLIVVVTALVVGAFSTDAFAQYSVTPGTRGYERVTGGVFDLGFENLLLVHFLSSNEPAASTSGVSSSSTYIAYMGGLVPRVFIIDNLALGLSLNIFYQSNTIEMTTGGTTTTTDSSDLGFIGFLMINYYLRLGYSLFFKPGVGVGGFYASRETPYNGDPGSALEIETDLYGFAGRVDLGLIYYAGAHFNLRAGIDIIIRYGSEAYGNASESFYSVDAAFGAGLGYSF